VGTFQVAVQAANVRGERYEFIEALVDTGASYSIFPGKFLRDLGVEPNEEWPFRLADEREREFSVGPALLRLYDRQHYTLVVFDDDTMQPLLGAVPLEEFGLAIDPLNRRLVPIPGLLMTLDPVG
jgi:aspartyl protease family protein